MAEQASSDWIEHDGAGCPVSDLARVQVWFQFDRTAEAVEARNRPEGQPAHIWGNCWDDLGCPTDIKRYRVVA